MLLEISAVFKIQNETDDSEVMFAKPSVKYNATDVEITSLEYYKTLKEMVKNNLPDEYLVIDATNEEVKDYEENN